MVTVGLSFLLLLASVVLVIRSTTEGRVVDRAVIHTLNVKSHVAELTSGDGLVGQLQDEPWGVLPPEVVRHGGEQVADLAAVRPEDSHPEAAYVE